MKSSIVWWAFLGAVSIGLFLGLNPKMYTSLEDSQTSATENALGEIVEVRGETLAKTQQQSFFHPAGVGQKLFSLDRILTGFDSEVLVNLGESFWLLPNSQIKIVQTQKKKQVHLLNGSLKRVNSGNRTEFYVGGKKSTKPLLQKGEILSLTSLPFDALKMETLEAPGTCLLYTSPSPRDRQKSRMPSSA